MGQRTVTGHIETGRVVGRTEIARIAAHTATDRVAGHTAIAAGHIATAEAGRIGIAEAGRMTVVVARIEMGAGRTIGVDRILPLHRVWAQ